MVQGGGGAAVLVTGKVCPHICISTGRTPGQLCWQGLVVVDKGVVIRLDASNTAGAYSGVMGLESL